MAPARKRLAPFHFQGSGTGSNEALKRETGPHRETGGTGPGRAAPASQIAILGLSMPRLSQSATVETDRFEHTVVQDHFLNPCCFGEDFATWLRTELMPLNGFQFGPPVMEDYGWGFDAKHASGAAWIALSYAHEGPVAGPATWVVSVDWQQENLLRRLLSKPDPQAFEQLAARVWQVLRADASLRFVDTM